MTSKERIESSWNGRKPDHVPLTTWCFGFRPKEELSWEKNGKPVRYWYSMRMEHIHTLRQPWTPEDDFKRVLAWQSLGIDDLLDVSIPWSVDPSVTATDSMIPRKHPGDHPVAVREYTTPSGTIRHAVKITGEEPGEGWPVQPAQVPLFEDFNIPRGVKHLVSSPEDIPNVKHLYAAPDGEARTWFRDRVEKVGAFAQSHGIAVQAWSAFGMDGIIWMTGVEGALLLAVDNPAAFKRLAETVAETDLARTELASGHPAIDMIIQRGWYSSTDFWSPRYFDEYVFPYVAMNAECAHRHGKKFGYIMTTGVRHLAPRLAKAGVDVIYFIDPFMDTSVTLDAARSIMGDSLTLVGGISSVTLAEKNIPKIRQSIIRAIETLGPTNRFILHPVDALFPDTPWESVEVLIDTWGKYKDV